MRVDSHAAVKWDTAEADHQRSPLHVVPEEPAVPARPHDTLDLGPTDEVEEEKFVQWMEDSEDMVSDRPETGGWAEPRHAVVERLTSRLLGRRRRG